jgi:hypothetical protein
MEASQADWEVMYAAALEESRRDKERSGRRKERRTRVTRSAAEGRSKRSGRKRGEEKRPRSTVARGRKKRRGSRWRA